MRLHEVFHLKTHIITPSPFVPACIHANLFYDTVKSEKGKSNSPLLLNFIKQVSDPDLPSSPLKRWEESSFEPQRSQSSMYRIHTPSLFRRRKKDDKNETRAEENARIWSSLKFTCEQTKFERAKVKTYYTHEWPFSIGLGCCCVYIYILLRRRMKRRTKVNKQQQKIIKITWIREYSTHPSIQYTSLKGRFEERRKKSV